MSGGRPPKFTPEVRSNYLTLLRSGYGRRASATQVGMSHRQVAAIRASDDEFRLECEDAEAEANDPVILELYKAAGRGEPWAVKMWLTNRDSGNWQEKVQVDQRVSGTVNVEAPQLGDILALSAALDERMLALGSGSAEVGATVVLDAESWEAGAGSAEVGACDACGQEISGHGPAARAACELRVSELADDAGLPSIG